MFRYLRLILNCVFMCILSLSSLNLYAHFQALIPSRNILTIETGKKIDFMVQFTHPTMGGPLMSMGKPIQFAVIAPRGKQDLIKTLKLENTNEKNTYTAQYIAQRPGDYVFFLEPTPYWEPIEGIMIIQYTKVVVNAFGIEEGWDTEVGLPVEIIPLTRPYGLWVGNLFSGIVKKQGQAVPYAEVEVEFFNDGNVKPPSPPFITQIIKADANGVFHYAMPQAGWWGFAALIMGDKSLQNPQGDMVPVEQGGVIWVHTHPMQ